MKNKKLVAKFMNIEVQSFTWNETEMLIYGNEDDLMDFKNMRFYNPDRDWNELMPVVEKIEFLNCNVGIFTGMNEDYWCKVAHFNKLNESDKEISVCNKIKIEAVYNAVIEFIKWYNKQSK